MGYLPSLLACLTIAWWANVLYVPTERNVLILFSLMFLTLALNKITSPKS